eukprot:jgi/Chrzof1/5169/Cz15g14040.t1
MPNDQIWFFDFLPLKPTSPQTALQLLTGNAVPGQLRSRQLLKMMKRDNLQFIGHVNVDDPLIVVQEYNR